MSIRLGSRLLNGRRWNCRTFNVRESEMQSTIHCALTILLKGRSGYAFIVEVTFRFIGTALSVVAIHAGGRSGTNGTGPKITKESTKRDASNANGGNSHVTVPVQGQQGLDDGFQRQWHADQGEHWNDFHNASQRSPRKAEARIKGRHRGHQEEKATRP